MCRNDLPYESFGRRGIRDVQRAALGRPAGAADRLCGRLDLRLGPRRDDHGVPVGGEPLGNAATDTTAAAGHERDSRHQPHGLIRMSPGRSVQP